MRWIALLLLLGGLSTAAVACTDEDSTTDEGPTATVEVKATDTQPPPKPTDTVAPPEATNTEPPAEPMATPEAGAARHVIPGIVVVTT